MNQQPMPFDDLLLDRPVTDIPEFNVGLPRPFRNTPGGGTVAGGWTFVEFLREWENNTYEESLWWKRNNDEIIGFESEGRKMFLGIAEIVISFHERKMFSGNLVHKISILPDLNVTHKSSPQRDEQAFEDGGQRSDIDHFRWMVAAVVKKAFGNNYSLLSDNFLLFFSEIFTTQEGLKYYFVSQLYHPIFFNSSDRCNLIRMMRDLYKLNPREFKRLFELESYGFKYWWLKIKKGCRRPDDAFLGVLGFNFKYLYENSSGFALPLYIRNVHEHFSENKYFSQSHNCIDREIDNLFPGVSAAIIDSAIRNLHGNWDLFESTTTTTNLPYLQRTSPYGWSFPYYRFHN
ncbi:hypothetical protein SO802_028247 [Lithocarpus litseifolius]|uniref:Maturase K n=1 Tax=Lithocarpus litseifolius TaxID=425828 RepID=A0AAW2BRN1_9ROSI